MNSRSSAKRSAAKGIRNVDAIKKAVLGKSYELSLVICGNALSHKLNLAYRGKDKPTNVLAFPLSKTSGEIFINRMRLDGFSMQHLFIHGLLHLKGLEHGVKMESEEKRLLKLFSNNGPRSLSRNRYRNTDR